MIPFIPNPAKKVVVLTVITTTFSGYYPERTYRPATHPIYFAADSPDKIIAALRGRYFSFLRKKHLENFMSRPNVIPAFQPTPLQNRGRNFVRGKR